MVPWATKLDWIGGCGGTSSSSSRQATGQSPPKKPTRASECHQVSLESGVDIHAVQLTPTTVGQISTPGNDTNTLSDILASPKDDRHHQVTAIFCVRRAGCGECRNNGLQLTKLATEFGSALNLFAITKAVDGQAKNKGSSSTAATTEFYSYYFSFPLYQDDDHAVYRFLGNRKISLWGLMVRRPFFRKNVKERHIGGDHFTKGESYYLIEQEIFVLSIRLAVCDSGHCKAYYGCARSTNLHDRNSRQHRSAIDPPQRLCQKPTFCGE